MADETKAARPSLAETHPEMAERHARIRALVVEAHEARRARALPAALAAEAEGLIAWAEALAVEAVGDLDAFRRRMDKDRTAFALALRLAGDEMLVRQLLAACDDLRSAL